LADVSSYFFILFRITILAVICSAVRNVMSIATA
jgi:hypothetical protein